MTVVPLLEVSVAAAADALASAFSTEGHPPSQWRLTLSQDLETGRSDARVSMAALDGARVVGVCVAHVGEEPFGHIGSTGVRARYRGRGVGRLLVDGVLAAMERAGRTDVTLEVSADNASAVRLYTSLGFRRERELHTLTLERAQLMNHGGSLLVTHRPAQDEAFAAIAALHTEVPAFQRRPHHLWTFRDEATAIGVRRGTALLGVALQRGAVLFDLAAVPEVAVVAALLKAALATTPALQLIHVTEDDPLRAILEGLGATHSLALDEYRWTDGG